MSSSQWSIILAFVAALATILGGVAIILPRRMSPRILSHLIAFGAGFMLSAAFVSMVPESFRLARSAPIWILAGYGLAHLFEHTFTPHFHFGEETHKEFLVNPEVSLSALVGLLLHAFFDGISISSGFLVTTSLGFLISLAVIFHKIPEGVTIASVMLASGRGNRQAVGSALVLAVATFAGAVIMLRGEALKGVVLALSAGITTYVAATDLIPELNKQKEMKFSASALLGILLYFVVKSVMRRLGIS